jgi:uncharacterized RDD family membrane protein YckC
MSSVLSSSANMKESSYSEISDTKSSIIYAGLWLRFLSALVDGAVLFMPLAFAEFIAVVIFKLLASGKSSNLAILSVFFPLLTPVLITWLYFAVLESSSWQATVGKKAFGLYVTDLTGQRLSFARATLRTFAKYLSILTAGIGYILCGFTQRKQALHDMAAGSLVLRRPQSPV